MSIFKMNFSQILFAFLKPTLSRKTYQNQCAKKHSIFEQRQNSVTNCSYQTELYKDIINKEIGAQSELLGLF